MTRNNRYLFYFLLMSLGIFLFNANLKDILSYPGLLLISISLMIGPGIFLLYKENFHPRNITLSFLLIFIPLINYNFIFFISQGVPVGYLDTHEHILQTINLINTTYNIDFLKFSYLSFYFVGLYLFFCCLSLITGSSVNFLATIIPPILNIIIIFILYGIVKNLHSHDTALLAMLFFGWETQILIFGQEYRTQTMGTLLIFTFLLCYFSKSISKNKSYLLLIVLPLLFSIVTSSFVIIFFMTLILIGFIISSYLIPFFFRWSKTIFEIDFTILIIFLLFFMIYLVFIGLFDANIPQTLHTIYTDSLFSNREMYTSLKVESLPLHEPIFYALMYLFYIIYIISTFFYTIYFYKNKNLQKTSFVFGFGLLSCFFVFTRFTSPLNEGRTFVVALLLWSIATAFCLLYIINQSISSFVNDRLKLIVCILIILFLLLSVFKLPSYIIGNTYPIRSQDRGDKIPNWNADIPQYQSTRFIELYSKTNDFDYYAIIKNYYTLRVIYRFNSDSKLDINSENRLIVLEDNFYGSDYTYRKNLPAVEKFWENNKIYTNIDYIIFT